MAESVSVMDIEVDDKVGKLRDLTEALKGAGIDIRAVTAWVEGSTGRMMLLTDDNDKACGALSDQVRSCQMSDAVAVKVSNEVGALHGVAAKLAEAGVAIHSVVATAGGGPEAMILLRTSDNAKAAELI